MIDAAIVGLGWWGQVLARAIHGKSDRIRLVTGVTRTRVNAQPFADELGLELRDSYADILGDPAIDAVILATPHSLHADHVVAAAEAGKHVFVEKPFTLDKASAERAARAVEAAGVTFACGFNRRFGPALKELQRRVRDGALGEILHLEGTMTGPAVWLYAPESWRLDRTESPAGGMAGMGVHIADAMQWTCGPITRVTAESFSRLGMNVLDDTTSVLVRFAEGMSGYIGTTTATAWSYRFQAFGTKGWAEVRGPKLTRFEMVPVEGDPETIEFDPVDMEHAELEAFAAACEGGTPFPQTLAEAVHSAAILEAVTRSAETGAAVDVG